MSGTAGDLAYAPSLGAVSLITLPKGSGYYRKNVAPADLAGVFIGGEGKYPHK